MVKIQTASKLQYRQAKRLPALQWTRSVARLNIMISAKVQCQNGQEPEACFPVRVGLYGPHIHFYFEHAPASILPAARGIVKGRGTEIVTKSAK